jgi:hypothetical protein
MLELVTLHFNLSIDYTHYNLQSFVTIQARHIYDPKPIRILTSRLLELKKL